VVLSDATRLRVGWEDWLREVEDLPAERGIIVSYEAVRQWCKRFGSEYARRLKRL
jgi:putative transposase